jgi:hypothetical protein
MTVTDTVEGTRGTAPGSATATPAPRPSRRRKPERELVPVSMDVSGRRWPADTFASAELLDGHQRGAEAALAVLKHAKAMLGTPGEHLALLTLRDFIAHAGAARLVEYSARVRESRCWAGFEALHVLMGLVGFALQRVDLDRLETHVRERLDDDRKLIDGFDASPTDAAAGRARAAAQRARRTGGAA